MKKIVVIVCGVVKKGDKYLLTQRSEPKKYYGKWQFPGGGLEKNETFIDCLKREMKEETGMDVIDPFLIPKPFIKNENGYHLIIICYLCRIKVESSKIVLDKETLNYGWFKYPEIKRLNSLTFLNEIVDEARRLKY